jgi:hypothetical protein
MEETRSIRLANVDYYSPEGRNRDRAEVTALRAAIVALKEKHEIRED